MRLCIFRFCTLLPLLNGQLSAYVNGLSAHGVRITKVSHQQVRLTDRLEFLKDKF